MIEIIHNPLGQEHPYIQGPDERTPRDPLAGEPFTVGIVTRPAGAAREVRVHACGPDGAESSVDAIRLDAWQPVAEVGVGLEFLAPVLQPDQDVWQAALTAPDPGATLTYWVEAAGQVGARHEVRGWGWQIDPQAGQLILEENEGTVAAQVAPGAPPASADLGRLPRLREVTWLTDGARRSRVQLTFECARDERFFGLGERFNALDQRGHVIDVRCFEQYKNQGPRTYIPIPFLLSSAGFGLYVRSARWMQFDLAASDPERWTLEADLGPDETLPLTWLTGDDPITIAGQFARLSGPPALPPLWAFGLWMSGNEWNSQARVVREVEQSRAHDITPSVMVIEAWSDETTFYTWNDAEYAPRPGADPPRCQDFTFPAAGKWPDPKGMADWLHEQGIRLVLWQIPVLKATDEPHAQHDADRAYFEQAGFGVREPDGSLYRVRPPWFRGSYLWDVTNSAERDWWLSKRAYLLDELGVDGFKTDGGEHLWGAATRFADGRSGEELWNAYPQLYTEAYYQFANEHRAGDALTFSRAGFVGSQRSPAHWAGDENSTWDAFRHSILAGLSAGLSGIPFWGWDIGGFSGEIPSAELYLRAAAMAAFCPIMQYHSEFNGHREPSRDRTPWNIQARTGDERVIPIFRAFVNLRHNLMPYLWQEAQHAAQTGEPLMRALGALHREASPYQYFFGRDLLVSPVVEEGAARWPVWLPPGAWTDLWTLARHAGGQTIEVGAPLDRIPVYVRAGARIPVRLGESRTLGEPVPLTHEANAVMDFE